VTNPTPSKEDITVTKAVAQAAALFPIALHDHPITGRGARTYAESTSKRLWCK
jgi:DNA repair protein RadC